MIGLNDTHIDVYQRGRDSDRAVDDARDWLFDLFMQRADEFGFSPDVTVVYPAIDAHGDGPFLTDPISALKHETARLLGERQLDIGEIVILTTYSDCIGAKLVMAGFTQLSIDLPAGPAKTALFRKTGAGGHVLYVEAVNEHDPKIAPDFVLLVKDADGNRLGGICGSIHERDGRFYAYIATMAMVNDAPKGLGSRLAEETWAYLRGRGVQVVHLGTQTADSFYAKQGFRTLHAIIERLRFRKSADGTDIWHDLRIMEKAL